jgi:hypothetical protein
MSGKKISIDFEKIFHDVMRYFSNLTTDMIIAYSVLAVGIVAVIIALCL